MTVYSYEIGTTSTTTNVESLTVPLPAPKGSYSEYSAMIDIADASVKGMGWSTAEWNWGFLTRAQRDQLRTFCTGASSTVFIRTRRNENSDEYVYRTGVMIWPEGQEDKDAGRRLDFTIKFRKLVAFTPPE